MVCDVIIHKVGGNLWDIGITEGGFIDIVINDSLNQLSTLYKKSIYFYMKGGQEPASYNQILTIILWN